MEGMGERECVKWSIDSDYLCFFEMTVFLGDINLLCIRIYGYFVFLLTTDWQHQSPTADLYISSGENQYYGVMHSFICIFHSNCIMLALAIY